MVQSIFRVSLERAPRSPCVFRSRSMRVLLVVPLLAALLALASCEMRGNANAAKTPPVPTATAAQTAPPAPPQPISSPQTEIQLPPEQPVSPQALATIQTV